MNDQTTIQPTTITEPAPTAQSGPTYLGDTVRSAVVPLAFPFELGGVEYREATVRRITGHEARAYSRALRAYFAGDGDEPQFPGVLLPQDAYAALDDDDLAAVEKVADGFFPQRFRPLLELAANLSSGAPNSIIGDTSPAE